MPTTTTTDIETTAHSNDNDKEQESAIAIKAQCLCKQHIFTTTVTNPSEILPLKAICCHCDSCRHVSGALCTTGCSWPGPSLGLQTEELAKLRRYDFSSRLVILSCETCSSPMIWVDGAGSEPGKTETTYGVTTGVLSAAYADGRVFKGELVKFMGHVFVGDTLDGGASCWMRRPNGVGSDPAKRWLGGRGRSEEVPAGKEWPEVEGLLGVGVSYLTDGEEKGDIPIRCHCGGVDLVYRAGEAQREHRDMSRRGEALSRYVDPETFKAKGSFDGCDSCRIWTGSDVVYWTFAQLKYIAFPSSEGGPFLATTAGFKDIVSKANDEKDPRLGMLTMFASSPGVQRYSCGRCAASIFYSVDDRPDMVDIAVGVLHSPDGARAERAIAWRFGGEVTYRGDMLTGWRGRLLESVEKEVEEWRAKRGYPEKFRK